MRAHFENITPTSDSFSGFSRRNLRPGSAATHLAFSKSELDVLFEDICRHESRDEAKRRPTTCVHARRDSAVSTCNKDKGALSPVSMLKASLKKARKSTVAENVDVFFAEEASQHVGSSKDDRGLGKSRAIEKERC